MNSIQIRSDVLTCRSTCWRLASVGILMLQCLSTAAWSQSSQYTPRNSRQQEITQNIPNEKGLAEKRLGQGVSYFYEGRYALSSKLIREALSLKLAHPADEAMAHQHLAFFYCLHDLPEQCEQEFRLALSGPTPIELTASERENPAWRAIYARVKGQLPNLPAGNLARGRFSGRIEEVLERDANLVAASQVVSLSKTNDRAAVHLQLAVEPWGDVYINQQKVAVTPPVKELNLSAGTYTIEIRNSELPAFVQTIALKAQTFYRLTYQFESNR